MTDEKITVHRHRITRLVSYELSEDELDRLQHDEPQRGYELSFALAALSVALSLLIPLVTGQAPNISTMRLAVFVGLITSGFVFFLFFGIRWFGNLSQRKALFAKIRARQIGPVGEKGTEISADALAELPSADATGADSLEPNSVTKEIDGGQCG
jgi:hypothetical protein